MVGFLFYILSPLTVKPTFMIKKILLVVLLPAFLISCKKDKTLREPVPNLSHVMSSQIDGEAQDFNYVVNAVPLSSLPNSLVITGKNKNVNNSLYGFTIIIADDVPITIGSYTANPGRVGATYINDHQTRYDSDNDFTIVISSITDNEIKGTFSGKVTHKTGDIKEITNGSFTARRF